ncbi:MAG: DNA starvation/stationary phase protection protein [Flavobacteriales bacterium]|nr:DNA starvation/stationary phase protection protein [Flavobacteriales bacterium]MCB9204336.1 DNA starvation/stationary phase protection protein [Flavobacteriales bacterium]
MSTNQIGLNENKSNELAKELNTLLANYQMFYQNLRGFHWNIQGPSFFELHLKFEELYNDAVLKVDEIAERVLTLGETPYHTFTAYLKHSSIKEAANVNDGQGTVSTALANLKTLLEIERKILALSGEAGDEGTNSQMSDYITQQEKTVWMLTAYLGKK